MGEYTIFSINFGKHKHKVLYECIEDIEKALLLGQLAMCNKRSDELIFITAGWNRSINENQELYNKALKLAEEYKVVEKG